MQGDGHAVVEEIAASTWNTFSASFTDTLVAEASLQSAAAAGASSVAAIGAGSRGSPDPAAGASTLGATTAVYKIVSNIFRKHQIE